MTNDSPYHKGERRIQHLANVVFEANQIASLISNQLSDNTISFIEQQSFAVVGLVDLQGNIWSSIIIANPGFIRVNDKSTIEFKANDMELDEGQAIALVLINFSSRQRIRLNGYVHTLARHYYQLNIKQAFPNCPRFIQSHQLAFNSNSDVTKVQPIQTQGDKLNNQQHNIIRHSDTFFVASANKTRDVDVSHKGGKSGFVDIVKNNQLRIPDYPGNNMFNTLGNFEVNPYAGITFIDFSRNIILNMSGEVKILWNQEFSSNQTLGSNRYWLFDIKYWTQLSYRGNS